MDQSRLDLLIEKYANGTATPDELEELFEWYRAADISAVEWPADGPEEREQLYQRMLQRLHRQINPGARSKVVRMRGWRVAASLVLICSAIWIARQYLDLTGKADVDATVSNPTGKIQAIRLPDSSRVWLNAATTIRYSSAFGKHREIWLEGEAYFEVVTDRAHPFKVHSGSLTTTVLGTSFNIKAFAAERQTTVSVIRGKVQVQDSSRVLDILTPARQFQMDSRTGLTQTIGIDTNQVVGWQQGRLQFAGQTMEEIAASLGRWYNVQFRFADAASRKCRYYLNFENTLPLPELLKILGESTGLTIQRDEVQHTVTLSGKECP